MILLVVKYNKKIISYKFFNKLYNFPQGYFFKEKIQFSKWIKITSVLRDCSFQQDYQFKKKLQKKCISFFFQIVPNQAQNPKFAKKSYIFISRLNL